MKNVIVLAMHGAPPRDFPRAEMGEFMSLHSRMGHSAVSHSPALESRYEELEKQAQPLLAQYRELMAKDLVALNEMVNKLNVPALYVPAGK